MPSASLARVLLDSPLPQLDRLFDYRVPPGLAAEALPGVRVRVPLRSAGRVADGFIIEVVEAADQISGDQILPNYSGVLSELDSVVSAVQILTPEVWALARRVADRAAGSASDVIRLAVPKRQVRVEKAWLARESSEPEPFDAVGLSDYGTAGIDAAILGGTRLAMDAIPQVVEVAGRWVGQWAASLAAVATRALLKGSVILCVPDYRDQEQLVHALEAVLPAGRVVRLDARQSNPERYRALLSCLEDTPRVIVGNRSAVYAPARNLAMIALWDDGDPLHSEPLSPYVHSRDAALVRQEQQGCALVFLGHTRSTEVQRLVDLGWLESLTPTRRYLPRVIPTAQQVSGDRLAEQARIPSSAWREAKAALERGPVLIQVARPGYAPQLVCEACQQVARCGRCNGPLGLKTARSAPSCAWCGAIATSWHCTNCNATRFRLRGQGAGRTAEDLGRAFPGVPVIVADGERPILEVGSKPALVIATRGAEPIAAGGYQAVLLLDGERMLARESLRVGEDCLRWWSNAIALAALGAPSVLVGVGGALAGALVTWRLDEYSRQELSDRRRLRFPPAVRVATVTGDAASVESAVTAVVAEPAVDVLGPVETDRGQLRAIVRLDYAEGSAVAAALRAEVIRNATSRRKRVPAGGGAASLPTLRVRFDDLEPFEQS
ncbi:MAG TPA: primosomal protein N' [Terrimesophilobacter sp.]|uniref:primosomal protein N' family DNA-binding protein n=1 Tax=Terrimesophilobacter sp. TaxID=2906435 RepID=UPI002F95DC3E